ncbi:MAG: FG-GAP-like repeat-containing protein [Planctomycetota bacterium]
MLDLFLALLTLAPLPQAGSAHEPSSEELAGHRKMVEALGTIRASVRQKHPFLEVSTLARLTEQIAKADPERYARQLFPRLQMLGKYQLREGLEAEAVASFRRALEFLPALGSEERETQELALHSDLAVAYLRLGERANCVARHTSQSCLLPIGGSGVHTDQAGSKAAIEELRLVLQRTPAEDPRHITSKWLLNIAYQTLGQYPDGVPAAELIDPAVFRSKVEFPHFPEVAAKVGLDADDISGSVIPEDLDQDGDLDLLTCSWDPREDVSWFENQDGSFVERSEAARLTGIAGGLNMVQADYDEDGDIDVLVLRGAWLAEAGEYPKSLLQNRGDGTFLDTTFRAGMTTFYPQHSASFLDYDKDGDLDVYVGSESQETKVYPSELFRNRGDGTFEDVAPAAGVDNNRYAKGTAAGDVDNDGLPDLFVSNFGQDNRLYRNLGAGKFRDVAQEAGVVRPQFSFACCLFDLDNDGNLDLFVAQYSNFQDSRRVAQTAAHYLGLAVLEDPMRLYRGDGKGGFRDITSAAGVAFSPQPMALNFGDLDNDGFLDLYLSTGYPGFDGLVPNVMLHNVRGERFDDVTFAGGFGHLQKGHGVAFADFDGDGDQDVFAQMGGAFASDGFGDVLFENPGFGNHWLRLTLVGTDSARSAIGARLAAHIVDGDTTRTVWRDVNSGGSFGSNSLTQQLGLGHAARVETLEVRWPRSGSVQVFHDLAADQHLRLVEGQEKPEPVPEKRAKLGG